VEDKLNDDWSPEEIAGRLMKYFPKEVKSCKDKTVSYESIYDWIYNGEGKEGELYKT
jgi:IS30 family transposase